jgi:hypothetical protein
LDHVGFPEEARKEDQSLDNSRISSPGYNNTTIGTTEDQAFAGSTTYILFIAGTYHPGPVPAFERHGDRIAHPNGARESFHVAGQKDLSATGSSATNVETAVWP